MKKKPALLFTERLTIMSLIIATAGVIIQIVSGIDYPAIPPVFFILLIPVCLIVFGRWKWTPAIAVFGGLFLTFGLFSSGASVRLFNRHQFGGSIGLWIQMLAVVFAMVTGFIATIRNYRNQTLSQQKV